MFVFSSHSHLNGQVFFSPLRLIAYVILAPLLLILILGAFIVTLMDFVFFRLRATFAGHTQPKGLWEF